MEVQKEKKVLKRLIKKWFDCDIYDKKSMEEYLNKQAEKGLRLIAKKGNVYTFEKSEESEIVKYTVDVFGDGSEFVGKQDEKGDIYKEYCEHAGWDFVCSDGKLYVFITSESDAPEIQTEQDIMLQTIHHEVLKSKLFGWLLFPILAIFLLNQHIKNVIWVCRSFFAFSLAIVIAVGVVVFIIDMAVYFEWYYRAKKSIVANEEVIFMTPIFRKIKKVIGIAVCSIWLVGIFLTEFVLKIDNYVGIVLVLILLLGLFILDAVSRYGISISEYKSRINIVASIILMTLCAFIFLNVLIVALTIAGKDTIKKKDSEPLSITDVAEIEEMGEFHNTSYNYNRVSKLFITYDRGYVYAKTNDEGDASKKYYIKYDIYTVDSELYCGVQKQLIRENGINKANTIVAEGTKEAYKGSVRDKDGFNEMYLLCYEEKMIVFKTNVKLNEKAFVMIKEKLAE